jgi:hypothetical protein
MNASLKNICDLFIVNRDRIKKEFRWQSSYIYPVCAAIFTDKMQQADVNRLQSCNNIIKKHSSIFSNFRGTAKLAIISMLAVSQDSERKFQHSLQAYNMLKKHFLLLLICRWQLLSWPIWLNLIVSPSWRSARDGFMI